MKGPKLVTIARPPDPKIAEDLERLRRLNDAGDLTSFAFAAVTENGSEIITASRRGKHDSIFVLIGAVETLKARVLAHVEVEPDIE